MVIVHGSYPQLRVLRPSGRTFFAQASLPVVVCCAEAAYWCSESSGNMLKMLGGEPQEFSWKMSRDHAAVFKLGFKPRTVPNILSLETMKSIYIDIHIYILYSHAVSSGNKLLTT